MIKGPVLDGLEPHGHYTVEHWRNGVKIADYGMPNYITVEGKKLLLSLMFASGVASVSPTTTWRMGLVDGATSPVYAQTDTYATIGSLGWNENTAYTDDANVATSPAPVANQTRPAWAPSAATGNTTTATITDPATSVFDITSSGTIAGLFIVGGTLSTTGSGAGVNMKADHVAGTLWSAATFTSGNVAVQNGDQLKVTYTVTA